MFLVIRNNEVCAIAEEEKAAHIIAKHYSNGQYREAKVINFESLQVVGHWKDGIRIP